MHLVPEMQVFSEELGLAGTIDLVVKGQNNTCTLIDWKTNKQINKKSKYKKKGIHELTKDIEDCEYEKYSLQLNAYKLILEKEYGLKVEDMIIVHLLEDKYIEYIAKNETFIYELIHNMVIENKNNSND